MTLEILPKSLLNGDFLHCRPIENGRAVEAKILHLKSDEPLENVSTVIVCPFRRPCSKCALKEESHLADNKCHYYRGDGIAGYQIIGPGMDQKSNRGYTNS